MTSVTPVSINIPTKANTQRVSMSTTSAAQTTAFTQDGWAMVTVTEDCFAVMAVTPVAVAQTCIPLLADCQYRVPTKFGYKLAFIMASGTGDAYVTEELAP